MALVVVGGHTRNIGKTSVVAGLIAALPAMRWTAIKITQYGHNVCSANGEPCDCQTADHSLAVSEERDATTGTDTSRYLAAGAAHSYWVRTRQGDLADAMPRVRALVAAAENTVIESNSVLRFLRPDLSLTVLDPTNPDFKPTALRYLDRVDALVLPAADVPLNWHGISPQLIATKPRFHVSAPGYMSPELVRFVETSIRPASAPLPLPNPIYS